VQAETAYWDVISARERIKVQEQALDLADQSLKRAKRELELGATPELEIYQPEQNYATAKINLTQVQFQLRQAEDSLRRFIGADLVPDVRMLPIVLTEKVEPGLDEKPFDREALIAVAMKKRPDLRVFGVTLDVNDLQIQTSMNALKPNLNLTGYYQTYGRGGPGYIRPSGLGSGATPVFVPGGPSDALSQMFGFNYNTFNFGLTLQLPLRDRRASADLADAMVNKKLTTLRQRTTEQTVRLEVNNAITQVENSRASVQLAKIALDYAVKRAEADQKRYDLGVINIFFLLAAQQDLTSAQANVVNQTVQYRRNLLTLQQRLGTLLDEKGIVIQ
jgi:outer membrane protein TolC